MVVNVTNAYQLPPVDCTAATAELICVSDAVLIAQVNDDGAVEPTQVNCTVLNSGTRRIGFTVYKLPTEMMTCTVAMSEF